MVEKITAGSGLALLVEKRLRDDGSVEIAISTEHRQKCLLHWGLRRSSQTGWQVPPRSAWPEGTRTFDHLAVQTPFTDSNGHSRITIGLGPAMDFSFLDFVLFFPEEGRWDNNKGRNYQILIPRPEEPVEEPAPVPRVEAAANAEVCHESSYRIESGGSLHVAVTRVQDHYHVHLDAESAGPLILHWGVAARSRRDWSPPPAAMFPPGTVLVQETAARTPFVTRDGGQHLELEVGVPEAPAGIVFVLKEADTGRWIKERGGNFFLPIREIQDSTEFLGNARLARLAEEIVEREMSGNSWTLMHRFNLCHDLLDRVRGDAEGLALLYVWLRYSALRQLDWQRNYNTKPRELSHAMERLTFKLAGLTLDQPRDREWLRLMLTTLGRGSNGQEVRDEILRIMHRHHIKEVSGHFLEEWHQKLHNNTTPDDVVICEAYLGFLRSNGHLDEFTRILEAGGVSLERLRSYERPINSHPDFVPHLKDALIHDFEHFLGILKAVHSGTDLGTAIHAARHLCDAEMHGLLDFVWHHRGDPGVPVTRMMGTIAQARGRIAGLMENNRNGARDLLFLDLALEQFARIVVERSLSALSDGNELVDVLPEMLENLSLSRPDDELRRSLRHWRRLQHSPRFDREWSLQAKAVLDRLERLLAGFIDRYTALLQPAATFLGSAFHAAPWTVNLFSEEVIRGQLEFALSALLRRLDPILRRHADIGGWQVISPGQARGTVETVPHLRQVQGREAGRPTVIVAHKVAGDEEIPAGVLAVITPDAVDIVSHVAVRARNARVLFASCFDPELLAQLESHAGRLISLKTTPSGAVTFDEDPGDVEVKEPARVTVSTMLVRPVVKAYAISAEDFNDREVGGKSNNIRRLLGKLPKWVGLPRSVALPFGVFEKVLAEDRNREIRGHCLETADTLDSLAPDELGPRLRELRSLLLGLEAPPEVQSSLQAVMRQATLPWPDEWEEAWNCIKRVWASKWNERAFLSRKARGIPHRDLFMAVLVQEVVEADYSFVIHTVNPSTGNPDEVYAEVVLGLGEALVGNYPGRALSFVCRKGVYDPLVLTYPSKSHGLYGGGLIFRSDSNGEDLAGFAGAGLYDSFMLPSPRKLPMDYSDEVLCWDARFRKNLLVNIALIGTMVEKVFGSPQDIEGACREGRYFVVQTRPQVGLAEG